jgi:hypothetical protein
MPTILRAEKAAANHAPSEFPLVQFRKDQRKDTVMAEHLGKFHQHEGVVFVGKAQEKTSVFRTEKRRSPVTGLPYPWIVRSTAMVRRLRLHGFVERLPKSFRYRVTEFGLRAALFFTRAYNRLLRPASAAALPGISAVANPLRRALANVDAQLTKWINHDAKNGKEIAQEQSLAD